MTAVDTALQAQVDAQLLEQGAFAPLELLLESGRLMYGDYESWRRGQIDLLDQVLMGNREKIRAELDQAVSYARNIGLVEESQDFYRWKSVAEKAEGTEDVESADIARTFDKPLRISKDPGLQRLVGSRYAPAQKAPQMDLFFDNPVVALSNGLTRALATRNATEAQRLLDRLYAQAPNHGDLPAFDRLLEALRHLHRSVRDAAQELEFLLSIAPLARRVLGFQARDLLTPLWRQLADALEGRPFDPATPALHRSYALGKAQDWTGVSEAVLGVVEWWQHPPLCLHLAESGFHRQRRGDSVMAWCHLCWHAPHAAVAALEDPRQPDTGMRAAWQRFVDCEDELREGSSECSLAPGDFPAWLLLTEPGLAHLLPLDLPGGETPGEKHYRCVHRWIHARRAQRSGEEMELRKTLRATHPLLFNYLKRTV